MPATANLLIATPPFPEVQFATSKAAFARPNDAVAYTAGDVVSDTTGAANYLKFPGCGRSGALAGAILVFTQTVTVNWDLLIFDGIPPGAADNAALALVSTDVAQLVGVFKFLDTHKVNLGTNLDLFRAVGPQNEMITGPLSYSSADGNLYGMLVTRSAFTPTAVAQVSIQLSVQIK